MRVDLSVDGTPLSADADAAEVLLDTLREGGITTVKEGCGVGVCGLCSVLVDGIPVSSCLRLTATCAGAEVVTAAGVAASEPRLARAFAEREAFGCGICTPGQLVMAAALLGRGEPLSEEAVRHGLAGNLCRCTGYRTIVEAVLESAGD